MLLLRGARQGGAPVCSRCPTLVATARLASAIRARSSKSASFPSGRGLLLSRGSSISLHSRRAGAVGTGWLLAVEGGSDIRRFDGGHLELEAVDTRLQLLVCQRGPGRTRCSPVTVGSSWE